MQLDFSSIYENLNEYENIYTHLAEKTIKLLNLSFNPYISTSIISNEMIHTINRDYRNVDRPTDVISFAYIDSEKDKNAILASTKDYVLGEIYISYEKALEQSKEYKHSLKREMCFLFVHGLLHLLGYDHMKKEDENIMFPLQEEILKGEIYE